MKIQTGHGMITLTALLAIYSISMVTSLPGLAISPILGDLKNIFKDASDLELQMLESLPSFIIVPFILLAGRLSLTLQDPPTRYRLVDHQHHAGSHHLSCWRSRRHQLALRIPRVLPVGDLAVVRF